MNARHWMLAVGWLGLTSLGTLVAAHPPSGAGHPGGGGVPHGGGGFGGARPSFAPPSGGFGGAPRIMPPASSFSPAPSFTTPRPLSLPSIAAPAFHPQPAVTNQFPQARTFPSVVGPTGVTPHAAPAGPALSSPLPGLRQAPAATVLNSLAPNFRQAPAVAARFAPTISFSNPILAAARTAVPAAVAAAAPARVAHGGAPVAAAKRVVTPTHRVNHLAHGAGAVAGLGFGSLGGCWGWVGGYQHLHHRRDCGWCDPWITPLLALNLAGYLAPTPWDAVGGAYLLNPGPDLWWFDFPQDAPAEPPPAAPAAPKKTGPEELPPPDPVPQSARLEVTVPAPNAEVWFGDYLTQTQGVQRTFATPQLPPGKTFRYVLRIYWRQADGQVIRDERTVAVTAGSITTVDYSKPVDLAKADTP